MKIRTVLKVSEKVRLLAVVILYLKTTHSFLKNTFSTAILDSLNVYGNRSYVNFKRS